MSTVSSKDAKAGLSSLADEAIGGEFVTTTRQGEPGAVLVPLVAAEIARKALGRVESGLVARLREFPGIDVELDRTPSRDVEL
ncbi:MAG: type II toxin-antitoxin system Phd/YefM family antitoxin [Janthinobacterium lividum]